MFEEAGLIQAILTSQDPTPRLVYADWLEDTNQGRETMRARFIRFQVERKPLDAELLDWFGSMRWVTDMHLDWAWRMHQTPGTTPTSLVKDVHTLGQALIEFRGATFIFVGGFVEGIDLPATTWYANAQVMHWHPDSAGKCPNCHGLGPYTNNSDVVRPWNARACGYCSGGVPEAPCPVGAHPLRRVGVAGWPAVRATDYTNIRHGGVAINLWGGGYAEAKGMAEAQVMAMADRYPGVEFDLYIVSSDRRVERVASTMTRDEARAAQGLPTLADQVEAAEHGGEGFLSAMPEAMMQHGIPDAADLDAAQLNAYQHGLLPAPFDYPGNMPPPTD